MSSKNTVSRNKKEYLVYVTSLCTISLYTLHTVFQGTWQVHCSKHWLGCLIIFYLFILSHSGSMMWKSGLCGAVPYVAGRLVLPVSELLNGFGWMFGVIVTCYTMSFELIRWLPGKKIKTIQLKCLQLFHSTVYRLQPVFGVISTTLFILPSAAVFIRLL